MTDTEHAIEDLRIEVDHRLKALEVRVENLEALHADVRWIKDAVGQILGLMKHITETP